MSFWRILKHTQTAKVLLLPKFAAILAICFSASAFTKESAVNAGIDTTSYIYETEIDNNKPTQNVALVVKPSVTASYSSRRLAASLSAEHTRVQQKGDIEDANKNFTDIKYNSVLTLIENALFFTLSGTQNYRTVNQQQALFTDKILTSGDLIKYRNNNAQLNFSIPNPKYFGLTLQSGYSKTQTEQSQTSATGVDGDNLGASARFNQGKYFRLINFDISAQYNDTSRTNSGDFKSTRLEGSFGVPIINKVDFLITGKLEEYDTGQAVFLRRSSLDTSSYGAGLKWKPSNERNISLTYNQLDEGDNRTDFVGLNVAWAFSSRTALNFDYGKRFYGDSYNLDFKHALKSLRTSVSYSEDVTTFSRLSASSTNITSVFVCQFGATELTECFQPDSLNYQLQAGEEFRAATEITTDISEEVLFRKSGTATIGYDKRRVKISIGATYQRTEYLESDRLSTNKSLRFNFNYTLGRKTNISFASSVSKFQLNELEEPDTTVSASINYNKDLGRYLKLNVTARVLDRESDNLDRNGKDKRLTVGLNYTF